MEKEKCNMGETHFISPPRPCAPNLWKDKGVNSKGDKEPNWILDAKVTWD